ncbi:MAG: PepSY domain-containing protein [Oscillospiraceae bacterium]|jgi:uncharacterized membrane protein YkoI|nr:PepSY domain-containing protein [Oscillospiraceae bacterium]
MKRKISALLIAMSIMLAIPLTAYAANISMNDFISDEAAIDIALELTGGGQMTGSKLTYNQGAAGYEVTVTAGNYLYVVFIDGYTGHVENFTRDSAPQTSVPQTSTPQTYAPSVSVTPTIPVMPPAPAAPGIYNYPQTQANITAEAAQSAALDRVGGGTVARTETHYPPHGGMEYKVIVVNGDYKYCVHVSAYDGSVIDYHMDQITKTGPQTNYATATVSADSAKSIAIQNAGGGIVTDCHLDYKPHIGALTYHIHVAFGQYEYCVELDASTGAVYKVEPRYKP